MSSSTKVIVQNLDFQASQTDYLSRMFRLCGTVNDLKINQKDENNFEAEITYSNLDEAKKAINDYHNKTLIKNTVTVRLADSNQNTNPPKPVPQQQQQQPQQPQQKQQRIVINDDRKEEIGEIVYPLAKKLYPKYAPKITGMILDAFSKLTNEQQLTEILNSEPFLVELVHAANEKHVTALKYADH